jgi:hypothetical protein
VSGAHSTLLASASHPVMSSSNAAAMLVIEALVTSLMLSGNDHVRQAEKLTEAISGYLYSEKPADAATRKRLRKPPAP